MKITLHTSPVETENELCLISELFEAGLDYLYIQKPDLDDFSLVDFTEQIPEKYWEKCIASSLIITKEFDLAGYHFTQDIISKNNLYNQKILDWLHQNNKISSVTANSVKDLQEYIKSFKQILLLPSISVQKNLNYSGSFILSAKDNKINFKTVLKQNYNGIDISDILWQHDNSQDAISQFIELRTNLKHID